MKTCVYAAAVTAALVAGGVESFQTPALSTARPSQELYGYVPQGFTAESYKKFKEAEAAKTAKQNLGGVGPRGFKSRSMVSFQEAMERGEATHLLPVFNAKERIAKGELKPEDIPYMQRGGSWDNTDVKGAKKKRWLSSDKEYASGGYKKEQSVSIFGYGEGLDWTGSRSRKGPSESIPAAAPKFGLNYKAPNVYNMKGVKAPPNSKGAANEAQPKKKFFGLF